jgi:hypothetical protein
LSGWIRIDKGLSESIRFKRVVRRLKDGNALRNASDCNETLLVTACLGAIVRLWNYADSHIRDDNRIDASFDEIDELVGIPGFAASLPSDWLVKVDDDTVELPDFLEHNGTSAKHRSDNARRQAEWRARQKNGKGNCDVTLRNARNDARPDQTRPEEKKAAEPLVLHENLPAAEWEEWLEHRRDKRLSMSPRALKKQLKLLAGYDTETQRTIIDTSINAGWEGLFPPKGNAAPVKPNGHGKNPYKGSI